MSKSQVKVIFDGGHQGLHVYAQQVSCLYWLPPPIINLDATIYRNVDLRWTGRRATSIHQPELLCKPEKKKKYNNNFDETH